MTPTETTDWERYYRRPCPAAVLTRRFTIRRLLEVIRRHAPRREGGLVLAELGGGASCCQCFLARHLQPATYHVVDNNPLGLELLRDRPAVTLHRADLLAERPGLTADVVFSLGLIEHYPATQRQRLLAAHFDLVAPDGLVVLSFPTPTRLYRLARGLAESLGLWRFPDEEPLPLPAVIAAVSERGEIASSQVLWPVVLTQALLALKPRGSAAAPPARVLAA
jgi:SAM-dependent methyltransferase